ncbi:MAG TPA: metallopeptidase family protein [Pseudonocardiaceae bacterium]|jgi:predicted Zn-dependent protease with MMP-like domain|nr:metallopeptidase family protein [Pseudonocardiaceae bacterium]
MPVEMDRARFEELVADALDLIPRRFTQAMSNVVVLVEDMHQDNPHLLGLYHGIALTRRTSSYSMALPDQIFIYRLPILSICRTEEEVVRQVAVTVVHEVGHHFGIDDATLHELGWG